MKSTSLKIAATAVAVCISICTSASAHSSLASFEGKSLPAIRVRDTICVSFRGLCESMGYEVKWDGTRAIASGENTLTAVPGDAYMTLNEERIKLSEQVQLVQNRTMVPIRSLANALSLVVTYDEKTGTATVTFPGNENTESAPDENNGNTNLVIPDKPSVEGEQEGVVPTPPIITPEPPKQDTDPEQGVENETMPSYTESDLFWLARIIEAEAGAESLEGKIAVGNVVLNRVNSSAYPNTIYDVIFDTKYGTQFEPIKNGMIYNTPSEESYLAAKQALEGKNIVGDAIYFYNPSLVDAVWIRTNCTYVQTIGCHDFYM